MKLKMHYYCLFIGICLVSSTAIPFDYSTTNPQITEEKDEGTVSADNYLGGIYFDLERNSYAIVRVGDYFEMGDYFVEFIGEGLGTRISDEDDIVASFLLHSPIKFSNEIVILEDTEDSEFTTIKEHNNLMYNVVTNTTTKFESSFGWVSEVIPGNGILFDNDKTSVATFYNHTEDVTYSYDYSALENSTHNTYASRVYGKYYFLRQYNEMTGGRSYYLVNIITGTMTQIDTHQGDVYFSRNTEDGSWLYFLELQSGAYANLTKYNLDNGMKYTQRLAMPGGNRPSFLSYSVYDGWIMGRAATNRIFFTYNWNTNITTYFTHDPSLVNADVLLMSGLSVDINSSYYLQGAYTHNSTHGLLRYDNQQYEHSIVCTVEYSTGLTTHELTFDGVYSRMRKDRVDNVYYFNLNIDRRYYQNHDRYRLNPSLTEVHTYPNVFNQLALEGVPYVGYTEPKLTFDFSPNLNRTAFIVDGINTNTLVVFENHNWLTSIPLDMYVSNAINYGYKLYVGGGKILEIDISALTGNIGTDVGLVNEIYDFPSSDLFHGSDFVIVNGVLSFIVSNYTGGPDYHVGQIDLVSYQYSYVDYDLGDDIAKTVIHGSWVLVYRYNSNFSVINFDTYEALKFNFTTLYHQYSGMSISPEGEMMNIVFLPNFNMTHGEIMFSFLYSEDGGEPEDVDLVLLSLETTMFSDLSKYGIDNIIISIDIGITGGAGGPIAFVINPTDDGTDVYMMIFLPDGTYELIAIHTDDMVRMSYRGPQFMENKLIVSSFAAGIVIYTVLELEDEDFPTVTEMTHPDTINPSETAYIRVDVADATSGISHVLLNYTYEGHSEVQVIMSPVSGPTWEYTIPAVNDNQVSYLDVTIAVVDNARNVLLYPSSPERIDVVVETTPTTTPPTTTPTQNQTTPTESTVPSTSEPTTTDPINTDGAFLTIVWVAMFPLLVLPALSRRRRS